MTTDLLTALKSLLRNHQQTYVHDPALCRVCMDAYDAIAATEGRAHDYKEHEGDAL